MCMWVSFVYSSSSNSPFFLSSMRTINHRMNPFLSISVALRSFSNINMVVCTWTYSLSCLFCLSPCLFPHSVFSLRQFRLAFDELRNRQTEIVSGFQGTQVPSDMRHDTFKCMHLHSEVTDIGCTATRMQNMCTITSGAVRINCEGPWRTRTFLFAFSPPSFSC